MVFRDAWRDVSVSRFPVIVAVSLALLLSVAACGTDSEVEPTQGEPSAPSLPPSLPDPITVAVASTDLAVGDNRVVFGLIRQGKGPIKGAQVDVETFLLTASGQDGPRQTAPAEFQVWPGGSGGVYVATLTFNETGEWGLGLKLKNADGSDTRAGTRVQVKSESATPALGAAAPRSKNRTARDVGDLAELTTDSDPDPELYMITIEEALDEGIPLVVSFATPAYCKTATCGPQLDAIKDLKATHSDRVNFLHVEVYDNPPEIRAEGISAAKLSPTLAEWGLPTEPWTFVMDADGNVRAKYEGYVGSDELEEAITSTLGGS